MANILKKPRPSIRWILLSLVLVLGSVFWVIERKLSLDLEVESDNVQSEGVGPEVSNLSDEVTHSMDAENPTIEINHLKNHHQKNTRSENRLEFSKRYTQAKNASEAQAIIDDIRSSGDSRFANDLDAEIHGRCGFLDESYEPPFERTRWAYEMILDYCNSYLPPSTASSGARISITQGIALTKLRRQLLELQSDEFDIYFMEYLANVSNTYELKSAEAVAKELQESGAPLSFGMSDEKLVTPVEAKVALDAAFELYGCVRFSGCESNNFRVLQYCVLTGNCEQGWNMFDIYSYTLAPNVYEQVSNILSNMLEAGKD